MQTAATSADGTRLSADVTGSGPPLVMVDPAAAFSGNRPLADLVGLLAQRFTVISYDRRGRGTSTDTAPYAIEREVEDIAAVLRLATGPATLFGFSSGAALALHAAAARLPITRLVALEPSVDLDGTPDSAFTADLEGLIVAGRHAEAIEFFHRAIGVPEEWVLALRTHPAWEGMQALAPTLLYDTVITDAVSRELLARVDVPTLVLVSEGSGSPLTEWSEAVAAAVPGGIVRRLPGHWHQVGAETLATEILSSG